MRTPEDYEIEIKALKAELERVRGGGALMTMAGAQKVSGMGENFTIAGLDEHILVVDEKGEIAYLNDRMAQLLGVPVEKRRAVLGTPVLDWGRGPLGDVISTLLSAVRESRQNYVLEREFPDLDPERVPSLAERHIKNPPLLRFACSMVKDKIQIVAQDITHSAWLTKNFSRYVSGSVIDRMREVSEEELMSTERRTASILFADLRGFTLVCQEREPEQVLKLVNRFLSNSVEAVEHYDGMVDKFVGDEIMAVFGAPLATPDHALRSLMTADRIVKVHAQWIEDEAKQGNRVPGVGVGVATGEVIVGNIGTSTRLDYTVLGHTVNLAARLCAQAGPGEVLTVKSTHHEAKQGLSAYHGTDPVPRFHFNPRGVMELKNILKPVEIIGVTT
jgi:class 3 adenylate cyclase